MSDTLILGAGGLYPPLVEQLVDDGALTWPRGGADRRAMLDDHAADIRVVVSSAGVGADARLIDALPNLELIANFGVGYDATDVDAATARGIPVTNTPDVLDDCVADLAIGLTIDVMRAISASDRYARQGRWESDGPYPLQRRVTGAKVGILGLGRIGQAIATRFEGFRCEIRYHNRSRKDVAYDYEESPAALAEWADVLVVATPGGAQTKALVDADVLAALGENGYIVNIARGSVVDQEALIEALQHDAIAGAALDVFADEPSIPQELCDLDTVVITPHVASATHETRRAMADVVLANIDAHRAGQELPTRVN